MDVLRRYSDPQYLMGSDICSSELGSDMVNLSNEDVILASKNPKKRDGRKKFKETRHPVYRGVRRKNPRKWVSEVREPNKKSRIWLGTFPTAEMAARAHDVASIALRGRSGCLNFADSAWRLPVPASPTAKDIQRAAAEAAEAFRPAELDWVSGEELSESLENAAAATMAAAAAAAAAAVAAAAAAAAAAVAAAAAAVAAAAAAAAVAEERETERVLFMDDEAVFGMPELLRSMAEGMLLPPPHCYDGENMETDSDVSLWNY